MEITIDFGAYDVNDIDGTEVAELYETLNDDQRREFHREVTFETPKPEVLTRREHIKALIEDETSLERIVLMYVEEVGKRGS